MFWPKLQKAVFIIFLAAIIISLLCWQFYGQSFELEKIRSYVKNFGIWAPLIFTILFALAAIFIPATPLMAIAGLLFGFKYGLFYTLIGCIISSELLFYASRKLGKEGVEKFLENKYLKPIKKYNHRLESGGTWDLVFMRLIPFIPFNVLNIIMGVSKIPNRNYLIGSFIGLIPSNMVGVYLGSFITMIF